MGLLDRLAAQNSAPAKRLRSAASLYAAAVAQARAPGFYTALGVPDSLDGRFELIVLHIHLLCRRLGRAGAEGAALAQALFDTMFRDMDRNLREMGVSDPSLPRRIRAMVQAYYGRAKAYDAALAAAGEAGDKALAAALARNVYDRAADAPPPGVARLAAYVRAAAAALDAQAGLLRGEAAFPPLEG
jgi:cytochrome b pre-mRNA-processing protein 3